MTGAPREKFDTKAFQKRSSLEVLVRKIRAKVKHHTKWAVPHPSVVLSENKKRKCKMPINRVETNIVLFCPLVLSCRMTKILKQSFISREDFSVLAASRCFLKHGKKRCHHQAARCSTVTRKGTEAVRQERRAGTELVNCWDLAAQRPQQSERKSIATDEKFQ